MNRPLEELKLTIKQAWLTLAMLPDPDARYRRALGGGWVLRVVEDAHTAYGATPANWKGTPSPHEISTMEAVFDWILWLLNKKPETKQDYEIVGRVAVARVAAWALGSPAWKMAQRDRCSEKTVRNRIDRSIAKILLQFQGETVKIEEIDEPELRPARIRGFAPPRGTVEESLELPEAGKIFIDGIGMMYKGEKYRSAAVEGGEFRGKRRG